MFETELELEAKFKEHSALPDFAAGAAKAAGRKIINHHILTCKVLVREWTWTNRECLTLIKQAAVPEDTVCEMPRQGC